MDIEKIQKSLWAIGIDFGTTKTIVASFPRTTNQERVKPSFSEYNSNVADSNRSDAVPTAIALHKNSLNNPGGIKFLIGRQALDLQKKDYQNYQLITDLKKRLMTNSKEERAIQIDGKYAEIEGVAASFLWKVLSSTENLNLKSETYGISISVPAKAHLIQRMSTKLSLAVTGFEQQIDLVEEPVAAFLYHRHLKPTYFQASGRPRFALVVDFGGGTCDLAIVEYSDGKLPKVRGRAMGIFGGQIIDSLLVEKLWLNRKSREEDILRLTTKDFTAMLDFQRWKILEKARSVKEYLSGSNNAISVDISGYSPNQTGRISTPRTTTAQLAHILETEGFTADYDSISNSVTASLRGHLENLLAKVLENAEIKRGQVSTLILAGGSVSLPGIKDWVIRFLSSDAGIGTANTQLKDNNVFENDNLQCVAGGAAVHQLYRYHEEKKWRGAITPTLSEDIWIINNHPIEKKRKKVLIGQKLDELPIIGNSYWNGKEIFPVVTYQQRDKEIFEIDVLQGEPNNPTIRISYKFENFFDLGLGKLFPKGVLIRFVIDDYEMVEQLLVTPGSIISSWGWSKTKAEYNILTEDGSDGINLRKIDTLNRKEVERLRKNFVPGGKK